MLGFGGMNGGVQRATQDRSGIETKFIVSAKPLPLGSFHDGWQVTWCEPDRQRVQWHVRLLRRRIEFHGCCD